MNTCTEPRFQCILTNDVEKVPDNTESLYFEQEEGKKSAFVLNLDSAAISTPAHVWITCFPQDTFLFGGLELVSNARNVEIYLTDQDDKEAYLTTCRGIVAGDAHTVFKCLLVCPGGPRPVLRLHLKLLSLKPASCTEARLYLIKLKGRLPPPKQQQEATATDSSSETLQQTPSQRSNAPPLTQADMGAAMAGVSMLVRSVESSLLQSVQASLDQMEKKFDARCDRIEQYLMLQQQQALIQQQQEQERFNTLSSQLMLQMKEQQNELVFLIGSLQTRLSQKEQEHQETDASTDKVGHEVQSENISKTVEHDDAVNDQQQFANEEIKAPSVSLEETSEPENELATENAKEATISNQASTEADEQDDTVNKIESGASSSTKDEECLEDEDTESENKGYRNASTSDTSDEVDEIEDCNAETANRGTSANVKKGDEGADPPVQSDDMPSDEESVEGSYEMQTSDKSDDTPKQGKQRSPDQPDVTSASENTPKSATNSSSCKTKKEPIMNERADAWEIPDLLSDTSVNEVTEAASGSSVSH
jgi:hypothetical protein